MGFIPSVPAALEFPNCLKAVCSIESEYKVGPSAIRTASGEEVGLCSALACTSVEFGNRASMITAVDSVGEVVKFPFGRLTSPRETLGFLKAPLQNLAISAVFCKDEVIFFQDALLAFLMACL